MKTGPLIVFLAGPSGVGKSTVASWIAEDLQFLFFEIDTWDTDGIAFHHLRVEWDTFWEKFQAVRSGNTLAVAECYTG